MVASEVVVRFRDLLVGRKFNIFVSSNSYEYTLAYEYEYTAAVLLYCSNNGKT